MDPTLMTTQTELIKRSNLDVSVFHWLKRYDEEGEMAKNYETPKQLENALTLLSMQKTAGQQTYRKVESMAMAFHLLQQMIANEQELECEHWLIPHSTTMSANDRRQAAIQTLMSIINERILRTSTMSSIMSDL